MILASPKMIKEWTEKGAWGTKTLIDYFKENVARTPEKVCVVDPYDKEELLGLKPERLTYREFDRAAEATAEGLVAMGIRKDDIIVVQLPNCWELAMLYVAIARAGGVISPMPMQWRASEFEYIAGLTEAKVFITVEDFRGFRHREMGEKLKAKLPALRQILIYPELREMCRGNITGRLENVRLDANDIFTLCWSSGTEARPKGCPISHNNWLVKSAMQAVTIGMSHEDTFLTAGPLVNMASVGTILISWLVLGNQVVLHHPFNPALLVEQIMKEKVTYTLLVPAVVSMLLKHPQVDEFDLSSVRMISIGGAPPSLWSVRELKRRWGIDFCNVWGQNESSGFYAGPHDVPDIEKRIDHFPQWGKPGTTWKSPEANYFSTKILDHMGKELTEVGSVGELWYRGPSIIPCYFRNPEATAKAFDAEGFLNTGDLFQIKDGDCLGFFDRTKDIIIRGGFNISAQEVENMVLGHAKVLEAAAVAMPDEHLGEKTCIFVVPKAGETVTLGEITSYMKEQGIATYKLPERLELVEVIPRNPVGKVLKTVLRERIKDLT